jgi:ATP-dependent DNA helicase RecQ
LTTVQKISKDKPQIKERSSKASDNVLFEILRKLRSEIAKDEGVPAYIIFNDATLKQLETERPMSDNEFLKIDGVGKVKLEKYGDAFIKAIIEFQKSKNVRAKADGSTYKDTLDMYQSGLSVDEIAIKRGLAAGTISSHLAKLYTDGHPLDFSSYITKEEIGEIAEAKIKLESPNALKPYFDYFEELMPYDKIRIGLAMIEKEEKN